MVKKSSSPFKPKPNTSGKILLIVIIVLLLVIIGGGAALFLTGALDKLLGGNTAMASAGSAAAENKAPPVYMPLDPAFVVNFDDDGIMRYLQISVSVMARDEAIINAVLENSPRIRNGLIFLFGRQKYADMNTTRGKEQLRGEVLASIQSVLQDELGKPGIEDVYFTNFVMQ